MYIKRSASASVDQQRTVLAKCDINTTEWQSTLQKYMCDLTLLGVARFVVTDSVVMLTPALA